MVHAGHSLHLQPVEQIRDQGHCGGHGDCVAYVYGHGDCVANGHGHGYCHNYK